MADDTTPPEDANVVITYNTSVEPAVITVADSPATIKGQGKAVWSVTGLPAGLHLEITFTNGCPFPDSAEQPDLPGSGVYTCSSSIATLQARKNTNREWPYDVTVGGTNKGGVQPAPGMIVIEKNP